MPIPQEQWDKRREQQRAAAERQRTRRAEQLADPDYRQAQYDKARAAQERQREKMSSPEYRKHRMEVQARKATSSPIKTRKRIVSRGNKGRTPTAAERRVMNALGSLPCIACYIHGKVTEEISLHHIDGRTEPGAHYRVLPLCVFHHQHAAPADMRAEYPWLVPVHAAGNVGGRAEFERLNAGQRELLDNAYKLAGVERLTNTN